MSDLAQKIAIKSHPFITSRDKFGRTLVLGSADTNEDVWEGGGEYSGFNATSGETISLVSTSTSDVGVIVELQGLDGDYNYQTEQVTLNGTTAVTSTLSFIRCGRGFVAGSQACVGTITFNQSVTTANVFGVILPDFQQTNTACFTVPNGYSCLITQIDMSMARTGGTAGSALAALYRRNNGGVFRAFRAVTLTTSYPYAPLIQGGILFAEKTDIKAKILDISDNGSYFKAELEYFLIPNT